MDPRLEKDGDAAVIGDGYEGGAGTGTGGGGGRLSTPVPMVPVVSLLPHCSIRVWPTWTTSPRSDPTLWVLQENTSGLSMSCHLK